MKLVELLATEIAEWHEKSKYAMQDADGNIYFVKAGEPKWKEEWGQWAIGAASISMNYDQARYGENLSVSDDFKETKVTRAQWQAERDRQKVGEWKRHRGGSVPVDALAVVEVKLRDATLETHRAECFNWRHDKTPDDIMSYRVISQPQAEEVEVNKFCMGENCNATAESIVHSHECEAEHEAAYTGVWAQSTGPLAWRDTIIHCQAIIEDCEREIERSTQKLAAEGFELIALINSNLDKIDATLESAVDMGDWRNWKVGDLVTSNTDYNRQFTQGKKYKLTKIYEQCGTPRISIEVDDKGEANGWIASNFKFHSRP